MTTPSFQDSMREAAAIKSAQLSRFRRMFDSWPQFHQAGLYFNDKFTHLRDAPLAIKIEAFKEKKDEGTDFFKEGDYQRALYRYEEALCMFRWVTSRIKDWKNNPIEDCDLTVHFEDKSPPVVECMVACYLNIALCNLKLNNCSISVLACDEALNLQPTNSKALYRKAIALTQPAGSDLDDYKTAIKLLEQAAKVDSTNEIIQDKIKEFKQFLAVQRAKSKETFHSFFKKQIVKDTPAVDDKASKIKEFEKVIEKAEELAQQYKAEGKTKAAKSLMRKTKEVKKKFNSNIDPFDIDNPSELMLKNAVKYGLDLSDPAIKAELKRLKAEGTPRVFPKEKKKESVPKQESQLLTDYQMKALCFVFLLIVLAFAFWYEFSNSLRGLD